MRLRHPASDVASIPGEDMAVVCGVEKGLKEVTISGRQL